MYFPTFNANNEVKKMRIKWLFKT